MKRFRLILTVTAASIILSSFAIAFKPLINLFGHNTAQSVQQIQSVPIGIVSDHLSLSLESRPFLLQSRASATLYPLTMTLPDHPGKRFVKLSFSFNPPKQRNEVALVNFDLPQTRAFVGSPAALKQSIAIKGAWVDETGTLWVEFGSAVMPKTTLTVLFEAQKPASGMTFEYAIAAYPEAKYAVPVFVGDGSLTL